MIKKVDLLVYLTEFFFSSGYDHVLLESYLVPYLVEEKWRPKLEKRGNKVLTIKTKKGPSFRDITKLLAPSTNLAGFGRLFGLEQEKADFPFSYLDSIKKLHERQLPSDVKHWESDLKGGQETAEDLALKIARSQQLFVQAGCQTLGDYLKHYLMLDVEILFRATHLWRRDLAKVIDIDFIEHRKFTISSLSYLAGQRSAAQNLSIGTFSVNNSQIYKLLRQGMRG